MRVSVWKTALRSLAAAALLIVTSAPVTIPTAVTQEFNAFVWRIPTGRNPNEYDLRWHLCLDRGVRGFQVKLEPARVDLGSRLSFFWETGERPGESRQEYALRLASGEIKRVPVTRKQLELGAWSDYVEGNQATFRILSDFPNVEPNEPRSVPPSTVLTRELRIAAIRAEYPTTTTTLSEDDPAHNRYTACRLPPNEFVHAISMGNPLQFRGPSLTGQEQALDYYVRPENQPVANTNVRLSLLPDGSSSVPLAVRSGDGSHVDDSAFFTSIPIYTANQPNPSHLSVSYVSIPSPPQPMYLTVSASRVHRLLDYVVEFHPAAWNSTSRRILRHYLSLANMALMSATDGYYRFSRFEFTEDTVFTNGDIYVDNVWDRGFNASVEPGNCRSWAEMVTFWVLTRVHLLRCEWARPQDNEGRVLAHEVGHLEFGLSDEYLEDANLTALCPNSLMGTYYSGSANALATNDFCWIGNHIPYYSALPSNDSWAIISEYGSHPFKPRGTPQSDVYTGIHWKLRKDVIQFVIDS